MVITDEKPLFFSVNNQNRVYQVRFPSKTGTYSNRVKNTPHEPRDWPNATSHLFLRRGDTGTPGYMATMAGFSTALGCLFLQQPHNSLAYGVLCVSLLLPPPPLVCSFALFQALSPFTHCHLTFCSNIMRTWTGASARLHKYAQTNHAAHVSRTGIAGRNTLFFAEYDTATL